MLKTKLKQVFTAWVVAGLLLSSVTVIASPALIAAPVAQTLESQAVAGVLTGGQFAKIWLGLTPQTRGENITIMTEWDRNEPENNGLGFFVLDAEDLNSVLDGTSTVRDANLSAGSKLSPQAPANQLGAVINATGDAYTLVLFNDSPTDASFTLRVTNGSVSDDAGQVRDINAAPVAADDTTTAITTTTTTTDTGTTTDTAAVTVTATPAVATPAPVAPAAAPATTTTATTGTTTTTTTVQPSAVTVGASGEVRAQELRGELTPDASEDYLGLEPSERDAEITLTLSFDPQDNSELARRLNFWVLDETGFNSFRDADAGVVLSQIAIAAGSTAAGLQDNQRQARFTASGFGPYTVIVYNNSTVPATYSLRVDGGTLIDDAGQTLNAQATMTDTVSAPATGDAAPAADAAAPAADGTPAPAASGGREGEPGGTYVVASGDSLSLIARDIYGDLSLWDEICAFNNLADCNNIEVGDSIRLPTREEIGAGIAPAAATATPTPAADADAADVDSTTATTATETTTDTTGAATTGGGIGSRAAITSTDTTTATETTTDTTGSTTDGGVNLVAALEAAGGFNTLVQALDAAGLTAALEGAGPFTIFAPTDAAFAALPAGALDQRSASPTGQLTQILLFHVLPGRVTAEDLSNGLQATTQQGKAVTFEVAGGVKVNGATVTAPDIAASNGVIHAIDAVILPPPE